MKDLLEVLLEDATLDCLLYVADRFLLSADSTRFRSSEQEDPR